ncbi:MAG: hypothetical protein A2132_01445 [Nitrospirae bacterium RBG_16_43_11]|nr:MAG: hypothetical protein A2132_01445 [Nitrospirae bacterium RBG_16_43_11]
MDQPARFKADKPVGPVKKIMSVFYTCKYGASRVFYPTIDFPSLYLEPADHLLKVRREVEQVIGSMGGL